MSVLRRKRLNAGKKPGIRGGMLLGLVLAGCSPGAPVQAPRVEPESPVSPRVNELPPLTADEEALIEPLRRRVEHLSQAIGERNEQKHWELAEAADYLAQQLEALGMPVERQGYETQNVAVQNLAVTIPGGERGDQIVVVGVHYDSPSGDNGRSAGASGTASLLALVELMKGANLKRTLRFVLFSMGEGPHGDGEARGARHYSRLLTDTKGRALADAEGSTTKRAETVGVLLLDRLGNFDPQKRQPQPLELQLTKSPQSETVRRLFLEDLDQEVFALREASWSDGDADSDLGAFHESGIPGVSLSGVGDDGAPVQYENLARVVMQIRRGIGRICGERPTNDGMLTPLTEQIR